MVRDVRLVLDEQEHHQRGDEDARADQERKLSLRLLRLRASSRLDVRRRGRARGGSAAAEFFVLRRRAFESDEFAVRASSPRAHLWRHLEKKLVTPRRDGGHVGR